MNGGIYDWSEVRVLREHYRTKIVTIEPTQSQFKMNAICCKSCNAILSVTNFFDTSAQLKKIGEKLGIRF